MRRALATIATVFALTALPALAASSSAPASSGPYTLDPKGKCHDASGKFAKKALCAAPKHCRDMTTKKFAKCGAPNTEPVPEKTH